MKPHSIMQFIDRHLSMPLIWLNQWTMVYTTYWWIFMLIWEMLYCFYHMNGVKKSLVPGAIKWSTLQKVHQHETGWPAPPCSERRSAGRVPWWSPGFGDTQSVAPSPCRAVEPGGGADMLWHVLSTSLHIHEFPNGISDGISDIYIYVRHLSSGNLT